MLFVSLLWNPKRFIKLIPRLICKYYGLLKFFIYAKFSFVIKLINIFKISNNKNYFKDYLNCIIKHKVLLKYPIFIIIFLRFRKKF